MLKKYISLVIILLALFLLALTNCSNIVNYSIKDIDIDSVDSNVKIWIQNNSSTNGTYIARANESDQGNMYYLYVNQSYKEISINSGGKNSIIIDVKASQLTKNKEALFCINVKDTSLKKFVLNGNDIRITEISDIK